MANKITNNLPLVCEDILGNPLIVRAYYANTIVCGRKGKIDIALSVSDWVKRCEKALQMRGKKNAVVEDLFAKVKRVLSFNLDGIVAEGSGYRVALKDMATCLDLAVKQDKGQSHER